MEQGCSVGQELSVTESITGSSGGAAVAYPRGMVTSVRTAVVADAAEIAAVHASARRVGYQDFIDPDLLDATFTNTDFTALWEQRLGADKPPVVFVASRDGELVGYCMLLLPSGDRNSDGVIPETDAHERHPTRVEVRHRGLAAG